MIVTSGGQRTRSSWLGGLVLIERASQLLKSERMGARIEVIIA